MTHAWEAQALYVAAERLRRETLDQLDPEATVEDVLGQSLGRIGGRNSLDIVEQLIAIEEEFGLDAVDAEREVTPSLLSEAVLRVLLGDIAHRTTWSGETIWPRSLRGIINELVRWRGGCTCAQTGGGPATR